LREFGATAGDASSVILTDGPLRVDIGFSSARAFAGQEIGFYAKFTLEPGWHSYGTPLPDSYTATSIVFNDPRVREQRFEWPPARPMELAALRETLPVYEASFEGIGALLLKFPMESGATMLTGELSFQLCSADICEAPRKIAFRLPLQIEEFVVAVAKK
jgi:hypothetical protein